MYVFFLSYRKLFLFFEENEADEPGVETYLASREEPHKDGIHRPRLWQSENEMTYAAIKFVEQPA
ncbi:hypothetical protein A0U94_12385 [Gluconobacter albidus]|nr:hypothetical protein A0U94_12385 [Gluconobacter albidus]